MDAKVYAAIRDMNARELAMVLTNAKQRIHFNVKAILQDQVRSLYQDGTISAEMILAEYDGGL